jgi:hypothetical protein
MRLGVHLVNFTPPGGPESIGPELAATGAAADTDGLVEPQQAGARLLEEQLAGRGQAHAALGPLQQPRLERSLDFLDLHGQRGRGDAQPLGGAREMQFFGHRHEIAEMSQLHPSPAGMSIR